MEYLEKRGEYQQANSILKLLLTQKSFAASHRGHWFDRLALNLDYHLGDKNEVLVVLVISNFHSVGLLVLHHMDILLLLCIHVRICKCSPNTNEWLQEVYKYVHISHTTYLYAGKR